jgi:ABC-type uncharacterized transport system permease subunit
VTIIETAFEATIRTATPLLLAATGEVVAERAGVLNIALEGCIIAGAFAAFVAGAPVTGYPAAALAGLVVGLLLGVFAVLLRRDQIIVGTALTMLALGVTGTLFRARDPSAAVSVATEGARAIPLLADIPFIGNALFRQPLITYFAYVCVPLLWWFMRRTHAGLSLRSVGSDMEAARAAGLRVTRIRFVAVLFGSTMGGLAGGALVLAQAGSFAEGMSAGRGFLAIAIVALGRWQPWGVALASVVFGTSMALQYVVQAAGWSVRYEIALMIPYALTLVALALFGRASAPAMLGRATD